MFPQQQYNIPYNNQPALPNVQVGYAVQQHVQYIASAIYQEMSSRNTQLSMAMVNMYSQNTFQNPLFTSALQASCDMVDYLVIARGVNIGQAVQQVVPSINDYIAYKQCRDNANMLAIATDYEKNRLYQSAMKVEQMKPEVLNYLRASSSNQPPQMFGQQPQPNSFINKVLSRGTPVQQYGGYQQPQQMFGNQGFQPQQMFGQQPAQFNNGFNNGFNQPMQHGFNPANRVQQAGFSNPWLNQGNNVPPQPMAPNYPQQQMQPRQQSQQPSRFANPLNTAKSQNVNNEAVEYEYKVREFAKRVGFPYNSASLPVLEDMITRAYPNNGFINPKNGRNSAIPAPQHNVNEFRSGIGGKDYIQAMTDVELRSAASQSKGGLMKDANGNHVWCKEAGNINTAVVQPSILNHSNEQQLTEVKQPYPFARLTADGRWYVHEKDHGKIERSKRSWYTQKLSCDGFREAFYYVDEEGNITGHFVKIIPEMEEEYKELMMKFEEHDYRRYFDPMFEKDDVDEVRVKESTEAFANAQVQHKTDELIAKLDKEAELIKEDGVPVITSETIHLNNTVSGEILNDDYVYKGVAGALAELEGKYEITDAAIRYKHAHLSSTVYSGEQVDFLTKLKTKTDWGSIVNFINKASTNAELITLATEMNNRATNYINNILYAVFDIAPTQFYMKSFVTDILDVVEAMENLGLDKDFNTYAARLVQSVLFFYDSESNVFKDILDETEKLSVSLGFMRDITTLPIHSRDIILPHSNKRGIVTKESHPTFHALIDKTFKEYAVSSRISEVVFVTTDNRKMYAHKTPVNGVYVVIQNSILENTVSNFA